MGTKRKIFKLGVPLVLGVLLVWYSFTKISFSQLLEFAKNANYWYILLGLTFGILSHFSRAYRWLFMAEPLGYKPKLGNSFMAVYSAYLINFTIPRAGEIARASILANYEKIPFEKGFGTIVAERVADTIMLLCIISLALFLQFDVIYSFFAQRFQFSTILIAVFGLLIIGGLGFYILKKSTNPFIIKIKSFVSGIIEGALSIFKMKRKWAFIAHTLFIWIMYVLMFYVTSLSIGPLGAIPFEALLIAFIMASFSIAATNGGIGSFPEAIVIALTLFSLPEDPSRAFGWIMWASQTLVIIILGGISLVYLPIYNRNKA